MSKELILNEDRFFDPDPVVRKIARELYEGVKDLAYHKSARSYRAGMVQRKQILSRSDRIDPALCRF
jgi:hypothetical protein